MLGASQGAADAATAQGMIAASESQRPTAGSVRQSRQRNNFKIPKKFLTSILAVGKGEGAFLGTPWV